LGWNVIMHDAARARIRVLIGRRPAHTALHPPPTQSRIICANSSGWSW
jgi:hypothetical protein